MYVTDIIFFNAKDFLKAGFYFTNLSLKLFSCFLCALASDSSRQKWWHSVSSIYILFSCHGLHTAQTGWCTAVLSSASPGVKRAYHTYILCGHTDSAGIGQIINAKYFLQDPVFTQCSFSFTRKLYLPRTISTGSVLCNKDIIFKKYKY